MTDKIAELASLYTRDPQQWHALMAPHLALLPDALDMDDLISFYLSELEPLIDCLNSVLFMEEYNGLKANLARLEVSESHQPEARAGDTVDHILESLSGQIHRRSDALSSTVIWTTPKNYGLLAVFFFFFFSVLAAACDAYDQEKLLARKIFGPHRSQYGLGGALSNSSHQPYFSCTIPTVKKRLRFGPSRP